MKPYKVGVIIAEIKRLQKEFPGGIYAASMPQEDPVDRVGNEISTCSYSKRRVTKGPRTHGCIVGQAVRNAYPELFKIMKRDHDNDTVSRFLKSVGISHTDNQLDWLSRVQDNQDSGACWGVCHRKTFK